LFQVPDSVTSVDSLESVCKYQRYKLSNYFVMILVMCYNKCSIYAMEKGDELRSR